MKNLFILVFSIIFLFAGKALSCDLKDIKFGSSAEEAKTKYNYEGDILGGEYMEMILRAEDFCKDYKKGSATITFFDNKLTKFQLNKISNKPELYEIINDKFGELSNKPNFSEIKEKPFAGFTESKGVIVSYMYKKTGAKVNETVVITDKNIVQDLYEFEASNDDETKNRE